MDEKELRKYFAAPETDVPVQGESRMKPPSMNPPTMKLPTNQEVEEFVDAALKLFEEGRPSYLEDKNIRLKKTDGLKIVNLFLGPEGVEIFRSLKGIDDVFSEGIITHSVLDILPTGAQNKRVTTIHVESHLSWEETNSPAYVLAVWDSDDLYVAFTVLNGEYLLFDPDNPLHTHQIDIEGLLNRILEVAKKFLEGEEIKTINAELPKLPRLYSVLSGVRLRLHNLLAKIPSL